MGDLVRSHFRLDCYISYFILEFFSQFSHTCLGSDKRLLFYLEKNEEITNYNIGTGHQFLL